MTPDQLIKSEDIAGALDASKEAVRANPGDAKSRVALFQIECVLGHWEKAHAQLEALSGLGADGHLLAAIFAPVLVGEGLRADVFQGKRTPVIFGEPEPWISLLVQANALTASGDDSAAIELRSEALEAAAPSTGTLDGQPFAWLADADSRLGPILEVIMDGGYRWVPFSRIASIEMEAPHDLRDLVWTNARFCWTNGGTASGFIPTRYPGTEHATETALHLARRTEWSERPGGAFLGSGQRLLTTDQGEYPLLEIRQIILSNAAPSEAPHG